MAFRTDDFVKETTTTTGTGAISLAGARSPAQTFSAALANGDTCHYAISHQMLNQWEVGIGTYNSGGNTITRTSVLSSSNADAAVNFSAGTKNVDLVMPAAKLVTLAGPLFFNGASADTGPLSFQNANGVSWGYAGGVVTASVNAGAAQTGISAFSLTSLGGNLTAYTSTLISSGTVALHSVGTASSTNFVNQNVFFRMSGNSMAGVAVMSMFGNAGASGAVGGQGFDVANGNGVTFGLASSFNNGVFARITASVDALLGMVSHVGGNSVANVRTLAFSNASNVTFSLSTAANAATLFASVATAAPGAGITNINLSAGTTSLNASAFTFGDSNGLAFGLSGNSVLTGSYTVPSVAGLISAINVSAGTTSQNLTRFVLTDSGGMSFGLNGSTLTGGFSAVRNLQLFPAIAGVINSMSNATDTILSGSSATGAFPLLSNLAANNSNFSSNNVLWRISAGAFMLAVAFQQYLGGGSTVNAQNLQFVNANGVSFGIGSSTVVNFGRVVDVTASVDPQIGLVSHVGGNSVASVRTLAFSNASNVTFSLSTAANAATVFASVAAGGGGASLALSNSVSSVSAASINFSAANGFSFLLSTGAGAATLSGSYTVPTLTSLSFSNANGVTFGIAGSTLTASVPKILGVVSHIGGTSVSDVSALVFSNAFNVNWLISSAAGGATVQASAVVGTTLSGFSPYNAAERVFNTHGVGTLMLNPVSAPVPFQFDRVVFPVQLSVSAAITGSVSMTLAYGLYTRNVSTLSLVVSGSGSIAFAAGTASSVSNAGFRIWSFGDTETLPAGNYWLGVVSSTTANQGGSATMSMGMAQQGSAGTGILSGFLGAGTNNTNQLELGRGAFSGVTVGLPASIGFTAINARTLSGPLREPMLTFGSFSF